MRHARIGIAVLIAAGTALAVMAAPIDQDRARPAVTSPQSGTGQIAGRIVGSDQPSSPIRRVLVTLAGAGLRHPELTATDDDGRFVFRSLPAGRFTLSATKAGYVRQYYGAKRPGVATGVPVVVGEGQRVEITMAMTRSGAISGALQLPPGVPSSSLRVHLLRATTVDGERRLIPAGGGARGVDNDGAFRIPRLMPGDYQLLVTAAGGPVELQTTTPAVIQWASQAASGSIVTPTAPPPPRMTTFSPVYFPGTVRAADAGAITIAAGQERDVTFAVPLVPSARVSGQVLDSAGLAPPSFQVWLIDEDAPVPRLSIQPLAERDGRFSAVGVTPGPYLLVARASPQGSKPADPVGPGHSAVHVGDASLWAMEPVNITGDDLLDVMLRLQPARTVSGRVAVAPGASPTAPKIRVSIAPLSSNLWGASAAPVESDADGRFQIPNVLPGRYRVQVNAVGAAEMARWAPHSAMQSGRDVLDEVLEVPRESDPAAIVVTMTDRPTEFSGRLLDSASRPVTEFAVVVFSTDPKHWRPLSRRVVQSRPGSDGLFVLANLPPGEYYVCAVTDVEASQLSDAAFLQQLVPSAFRITLAEGEKKRQDMRIGSGLAPATQLSDRPSYVAR
jgi:hypothetical protein